MPDNETIKEKRSVKRLLASDLWPMFTTETGTMRLKRFQDGMAKPLDRLIESLILYDEVVIPSQDFLIIPALINTLGEESVRYLLDSGALRFLRIKDIFAFEAGKGVSAYSISKPSGKMLQFAQELDELLMWISNDCTGSKDPKSFHNLLSSITTELDVNELKNVIRDESESDVMKSKQVRDLFDLPLIHPRDFPTEIDPQDISTEDGNMILYTGPNVKHKNKLAQSYLRLVHSNVEIAIAAKQGCDDISTATALDTILREKYSYSDHSNVTSELFDLSDIPNFPPLIRNGVLPLHKLIDLRNSKDGEEFRKWFHEVLGTDNSIAKEYVKLLKKITPVDSVPGKLVRILLWTGLSAGVGTIAGPIGTAAGAGAGLIGGLFDSFVMNKLRFGGSAKLFLDSFSKSATKR